ncbi:MAG TPA: nickel pincer cofactor biosynthesis protein LarB [Terriglobales bacterium]|nr:nickel pincer cofactor biosynthesis protein LarB [Terriglobales bacterium]
MKTLLEDIREQRISPDEGVERLRNLPFEDLGFAKLDHHRSLRHGMPEVIYAAGKTPAETAEIFARMAEHGGNVLATRCTPEHAHAVLGATPTAEYNERARTIALVQDAKEQGKGVVAILCAGTSDLPVAEEAAVTARVMGNRIELACDVGVAGLHRLIAQRNLLSTARIFIVCAGMEGALPSVVAGLVGAPVIAVPTSVGYGASFQGVTALLAMMNSCAPNVTVVNIDNGFGAAYFASMINRL